MGLCWNVAETQHEEVANMPGNRGGTSTFLQAGVWNTDFYMKFFDCF